MHAYPAYVGLGSNLRDPAAQLRAAFDALGELPRTRLVLRSSLYGSKPMGEVEQPDFCNAVAGLLTESSAADLLAAMRDIERRFGREPERIRWGPRVLDLDLLSYAEQRSSDLALLLPHPGIAARAFVLHPWREIAPDVLVPGLGRVCDLAARVSAGGLWRMP
ncbi:MAG: 2-amino-4-hydroxy-6-hydroxymethyldihydropteridine diphosphokinase [Proteobacteria bacterium]|nr:2-amino-4-hydroxy-6-hydroxymethyldihydropteridine diphosphokinase [Pseudomonadota bacterium]